jgi:uncharacterized RDD family membrane protein YckC
MHHHRDPRYAGFWIRGIAWVVDVHVILAAYYLFYLGNHLGAKAGFLPPIESEPVSGAGFAVGLVRALFFFGFPVFYFTWFHGRGGQTFGKMALRIRLLRTDGTAVTPWVAFKRWFVIVVLSGIIAFVLLLVVLLAAVLLELVLTRISSFLSLSGKLQSAVDLLVGGMVLFLVTVPSAIMFLPVAFDPKKQGLHDRICGTVVVKVGTEESIRQDALGIVHGEPEEPVFGEAEAGPFPSPYHEQAERDLREDEEARRGRPPGTPGG